MKKVDTGRAVRREPDGVTILEPVGDGDFVEDDSIWPLVALCDSSGAPGIAA